MKSKLSYLKQFENAPDLLIMHAGGMDIGVKQFRFYRLITNLRNHFQVFRNVFPILFSSTKKIKVFARCSSNGIFPY